MSYRILTVANNKGGVGKTLISKSIMEYAGMRAGLSVLGIDLDPQCNLSRRFLDMRILGGDESPDDQDFAPPVHPEYPDPEEPDWDGYSDAADIWLEGGAAPYPADLKEPGYENIEIIPGHATKLQRLEQVHEEEIYTGVVQWLRKFLYTDSIRDLYDLVIIDTRPSKGPLVRAAMHAATHLLVPSEMEAPSVEGLHGMLHVRRQANTQRAADDPLRLVGILPNKVQKRFSLHEAYEEELREDEHTGPVMLPVRLNHWGAYKESMRFRAPSLLLDEGRRRKTKEREQLEQVCQTVLDRMEGEEAHE